MTSSTDTSPREHGWDEHQSFEAGWWGNCVNTFGEETKQLTYAQRMDLVSVNTDGHWPVYDMKGKSVLDLGGGPASILLKCVNLGTAKVVDPCEYPTWIVHRYHTAQIAYERAPAEELVVPPDEAFDECWIYNVLQHVQDPEKIISNALLSAKLVRVFEWIDLPPHIGHPHELKAQSLTQWLGGYGTVEQMNENGCVGRAFYGVFHGTFGAGASDRER